MNPKEDKATQHKADTKSAAPETAAKKAASTNASPQKKRKSPRK